VSVIVCTRQIWVNSHAQEDSYHPQLAIEASIMKERKSQCAWVCACACAAKAGELLDRWKRWQLGLGFRKGITATHPLQFFFCFLRGILLVMVWLLVVKEKVPVRWWDPSVLVVGCQDECNGLFLVTPTTHHSKHSVTPMN